MRIRWIHILIFTLPTVIPVVGQYFENPSFEGPPGYSVTPPFWVPFDDNSTPDTEPRDCDDFLAFHGDTYITLVARGPEHEIPNTVENVTTELLNHLEEGKFYRLTIALASREDVGHFSWDDGFIAYTAPVKLKILASNNEIDKGVLLSESESIEDHAWSSYSFILYPQETFQYLLFEASLMDDTAGSGNLLLDYVSIEEIDEPPLDFGDLVVPNVFTPNGDGFNDEFTIRGLAHDTFLMVFDRTGREVFKSTRYENDWGGDDKNGNKLPPDTYWYILRPSDLSETTKGFVYLKR